MNINQLETLITLSETMSFRKAGELLNLTQPAVSAQIKSLEEQLNLLLVNRTQPVTLTNRGQIAADYAKRIVTLVREMKHKLTDCDDTVQGHLVIGTTPSISVQILPSILACFQRQFPFIKTSIRSMLSSQIYYQLERGMIDIGIGYIHDHRHDIITSVLYETSFELIVSPACRLSELKLTSAIDILYHMPLILLPIGTMSRTIIQQLCQKYTITPNVVMELSNSEEVKKMVELNLGAGIIAKPGNVDAKRCSGSLQTIPLYEPKFSYPVGVMHHSTRYVHTTMQHFLQYVQKMKEAQVEPSTGSHFPVQT